MPKQKYKQKPLFWNCIQYDGNNSAGDSGILQSMRFC